VLHTCEARRNEWLRHKNHTHGVPTEVLCTEGARRYFLEAAAGRDEQLTRIGHANWCLLCLFYHTCVTVWSQLIDFNEVTKWHQGT
jgi:hypothetical protein